MHARSGGLSLWLPRGPGSVLQSGAERRSHAGHPPRDGRVPGLVVARSERTLLPRDARLRASLACIISAAENARLAAQTGWGGWIGTYQRPGSAEPIGGWDTCSTGEANTFADWAPGEPSNHGLVNEAYAAFGSDVAIIDTKESHIARGKWHDSPCSWPRPCICEHGATSSANYIAFAADQEDELTAWTLLTFVGLIPALSLLPILLVWCHSRLRRLLVTSALVSVESDEPSQHSNFSALTLAEKQRDAVRLRNRVSGTIAWVDWALLVLGSTPASVRYFVSVYFTATAGNASNYLCVASLGLAVLFLALRPIDAGPIAFACHLVFALVFPLVLISVRIAWVISDPIFRAAFMASAAVSCSFCALIAPTILSLRDRRCARATMPPRLQLLRLWLVLRIGVDASCSSQKIFCDAKDAVEELTESATTLRGAALSASASAANVYPSPRFAVLDPRRSAMTSMNVLITRLTVFGNTMCIPPPI
jgi:hypothetical protein